MDYDWCDNCHERKACRFISYNWLTASLCDECFFEWEMEQAEHLIDVEENR